MYPHVLAGHSALRWLILLLALIALALRWCDFLQQKDSKLTRVLSAIFVGFLDLQLLFGILLFCVSPLRAAAFAHPAASVANETGFLIFFHPLLMLVAIACAHAGNVIAKRDLAPDRRRKIAAILLTVAVLIVAAAIPWWRPLMRPF